MSYLLLSILFRYPIQHTTSTIIVKIDVNIRQRNTVRIQETLEKQVILNRVNLCNSQAISYRRTCSRTTSRANGNIQLFTSSTDKVLYDKEVPRKTHGLHDMKLELDSFAGFFIQHLAVAFPCSFQSQQLQIIRFQLDTIQLIISTQLSNFIVGRVFA